jgi:putative DNA-invertase from lambdoid prophage Rac
MGGTEMAEKRTRSRPNPGRGFGQDPSKPKTRLRVALYARVSTHEQQSLPLQLAALRQYVKRRGWLIVAEVKEVGSGALQRPKREQLMQLTRQQAIDAILVWRLDRWGRSVADLASTGKS